MSAGLNLEPKARAFVEALAAANLPPFEAGTAEQARALTQALRPKIEPRPIALVADHDADGVPVREYRAQTDPIAAILYLHPGGWVLGSVEASDNFCRELAVVTGATVYSVEYRLAPEAPYPAAIDDAWTALRWLGANTALPIVLFGESAGGNLAAILAAKARDAAGPAIALQILAYPVTDAAMDTGSYRAFAAGPLLTAPLMAWFWDHYLPDPDARGAPDASPARGALHRLPPAFVLTAENDVLRDEGEAYADALAAAGNTVRRKRYAGQIHTFISMVGLFDGGAEALADIAAAVREHVA